jgi:small-conductance mechanosensitive channel
MDPKTKFILIPNKKISSANNKNKRFGLNNNIARATIVNVPESNKMDSINNLYL